MCVRQFNTSQKGVYVAGDTLQVRSPQSSTIHNYFEVLLSGILHYLPTHPLNLPSQHITLLMTSVYTTTAN